MRDKICDLLAYCRNIDTACPDEEIADRIIALLQDSNPAMPDAPSEAVIAAAEIARATADALGVSREHAVYYAIRAALLDPASPVATGSALGDDLHEYV